MPEVSHLRLAGSIVGYSACSKNFFFFVQIQNFVNMGILDALLFRDNVSCRHVLPLIPPPTMMMI